MSRQDAQTVVATLTGAQRAFLLDAYPGTVTTLRRDGSLHSSVVWVDEEDGDVLFNTLIGRAKERHLRRDPRASLLVIDPANQYRWLSVSGNATLTTDRAVEHMDKLWRRYAGAPFPPDRPRERVIVRIRPDRIDSAGL
jgi:PPOX class probable F420-dependent enzyme